MNSTDGNRKMGMGNIYSVCGGSLMQGDEWGRAGAGSAGLLNKAVRKWTVVKGEERAKIGRFIMKPLLTEISDRKVGHSRKVFLGCMKVPQWGGKLVDLIVEQGGYLFDIAGDYDFNEFCVGVLGVLFSRGGKRKLLLENWAKFVARAANELKCGVERRQLEALMVLVRCEVVGWKGILGSSGGCDYLVNMGLGDFEGERYQQFLSIMELLEGSIEVKDFRGWAVKVFNGGKWEQHGAIGGVQLLSLIGRTLEDGDEMLVNLDIEKVAKVLNDIIGGVSLRHEADAGSYVKGIRFLIERVDSDSGLLLGEIVKVIEEQ